MPSPARTREIVNDQLVAQVNTQSATGSSAYTITRADQNKVVYTNAAAPATITLPAVASAGQRYSVSLGASAAGATITVTCASGETFNQGAGTGTAISATSGKIGDCLTVVSDGAKWVFTEKGGTWAVL